MSGKIRWGVLGSGGIARRRTIPEGIVPSSSAKLVLVYDIDEEVNKQVGAEFGTECATSIDEILGPAIDAVYIATPANRHCEQAITCAQAGKHVLCEKPLGMSVNEAKGMIAEFASAGTTLGTAFMMRYGSQHRAAADMIAGGKLGKLTYGRAQLSCWYPPIEGAWRQDPRLGGGGSLIDMGGHCIDLLEMFLGRVVKVSCFTNNTVQAYESEDSAVALLSFENGAMATVDTFFCIPDNSSKNVLELYGSKGSILAQGTIGQASEGSMFAYLSQEDGQYDAQQARSSEQGIELKPLAANPYQAEIEDFSRLLLGESKSYDGAELGLRSQRVLAACYKSAASGASVEV